MIQFWLEAIRQAFINIGSGVADLAPKLLGAIVIFIVGWVVGSLVGRLVSSIIRSIKVDQLLRSAGIEDLVKKAGHNLNAGKFIGTLVEWFVIVAALVVSVDILGLTEVNIFLQQVLSYIPQLIIAVLILLVAVVVADVMQKVVVASARAAGIHSASFLGVVTRWSIWIFALLVALVQLNIAVYFINLFFTGIIVAIALAFGLAFGLGGQDAAARAIEKIKGEISHKA